MIHIVSKTRTDSIEEVLRLQAMQTTVHKSVKDCALFVASGSSSWRLSRTWCPMPRDSFGPTKDANSCMISTSSSSKCSGWPSYETYRAGLTVKFLEMARPCHFYEQTSSIWTSLSVKTSSSTSVWIKGLHVSKVDASDAVMLVESCKICLSWKTRFPIMAIEYIEWLSINFGYTNLINHFVVQPWTTLRDVLAIPGSQLLHHWYPWRLALGPSQHAGFFARAPALALDDLRE